MKRINTIAAKLKVIKTAVCYFVHYFPPLRKSRKAWNIPTKIATVATIEYGMKPLSIILLVNIRLNPEIKT